MIAKYNVKVNGRWYAAGDVIPEEPKKAAKAQPEQVPLMDPPPETEPPKAEEPKEKPRTASRRKASK